jgi:ABC-2 type transport system ATP-binding protein
VSFGVEDLTVRFDKVTALDDVSVVVHRGEVTAVVGGDGAGKTTLLRALAGLVEPTSGVVRRPDVDHLGYLPAGAGGWQNLTVAENVSFVGGAYGLSGVDLDDRADPILERAGLADVKNRLAGQLSGGMRTKLGFSLAMLHTPDLLVLDEPTTGVDPVSRVELWRLISETVADGAAVVMATTYMDEAERAASVVLLSAGRVLLAGEPDELIAAMPGTIVETDAPVDPSFAWRVGPMFHEWFPSTVPDGATDVQPNLEDVCIAAELRDQLSSTGDTR